MEAAPFGPIANRRNPEYWVASYKGDKIWPWENWQCRIISFVPGLDYRRASPDSQKASSFQADPLCAL